MLSPEYLQDISKEMEDYFYDLETEILKDIAERIRLNDNAMTSTANFQLQQLQLLGATNDQITKRLSVALNTSKKEVEKIISNSVYASIENDNLILKEAYEKGLIGEFAFEKEKFKEIILEGIIASTEDLTNICNTTAITAQAKFTNALNNVYLQVSSGAFTMDQAVDNVITKLAKEGLGTITYKSGAKRQLDTAVRIAIRSSVNKSALKAQEQNLNDFGCNLVEVTSHRGARPDHALWQGKIYWRLHKYKNYSNFEEATRYGHGDGLGGWNCRHSFYPFFEGISEKTFEHYRLKENNELYELQQLQRYNERKIREWDRRKQVMEAAGLDSTKETFKLKEWKDRNKKFIKEHSDVLKHNYSREKAYLSSSENKSYVTVSRQMDPKEKQRVMRESYEKAKDGGVISSLITFKTYNQVAYNLLEKVVGTTTKDDIMIIGFTPHMIDRIIGNYKASNEPINKDSFSVKNNLYGARKGVPVKNVIDALKNGKSSGVKIDKSGKKSIVYKTNKCTVSVNPDTGELIQTTPKE